MNNLSHALQAWASRLGADYVVTDEASLSRVETATYATPQRIPAVLRPADRAEVQACLRIAHEYRVPVYPISTGKNWGYGSRVPVQDGCVVIDLGRLNRIVAYDEALAYVTVEPGVTQRQLYEFLQARGSRLFLSATGSTPDSSLIGNILERGLGEGPYGDRFSYVCALEVVLPTGETLTTGFGRFPSAHAAPINRWGVGPYLDGLFTQSNLGIVTQMTLWLTPLPHTFHLFWYAVDDDARLGPLVDALRELRLTGVVQSAFVIANDVRVFSNLQQYPWAATDGATPLPPALREALRRQHGVGRWNGEGALYAVSEAHGQALRQVIEARLGPVTDSLHFLDDATARQPRPQLAAAFPGADLDVLLTGYWDNPKRGVPTEQFLPMAYWRKRTPRPTQGMDLDRDGCGLFWCAPAAPFDGAHVQRVASLLTETTEAYGYEPNIGLNCISERNINVTAAVIYDRDVAGEDERALACYHALTGRVTQAGYYPYRLGTHGMTSLPPAQDDYGPILARLKQALDPNGVLAPGRYEFST